MHENSVSYECQSEYDALKNIKDALRVTLQWNAPSVGRSRKLSSVLFIIRALQRHLERQLLLEESGGYLDVVGEQKPNLAQQAARLRDEHEAFRESLRELLPNVEQLTPDDEERFQLLTNEIFALLERLEHHDAAEADLLQEALLRDDGGEG